MLRIWILMLALPLQLASADELSQSSEFAITEKDAPAVSDREAVAKVGMELRYLDYQEKIPAPHKSMENGVLPAFRLDYQNEPRGNGFFYHALLSMAFGRSTYDGSL